MTDKDIILQLDDISIKYDDSCIVKNLSFDLHRGEILGILGQSGCGKTSVLKAIMGLLPGNACVTGGGIYYEENNLLTIREKDYQKLRGRDIFLIFQNPQLYFYPLQKIGTQIYYTVKSHCHISLKEVKQKAFSIFDMLSLTDKESIWSSYPYELSGGMIQRVGIALSLLLESKIILSDEITSALDIHNQENVASCLLKSRELNGTSMIVVSHERSFLSSVSDRIIVMSSAASDESNRGEDRLDG